MIVPPHHPWPTDPEEAVLLQRKLAPQVVRRDEVGEVRTVAGVDVSAPSRRDTVRGAVVVLRYPELEVLEVAVAEGRVPLPYIPGLLSFRESPVLLQAFARLRTQPDLLLVDGQGIAHPRRFGIASHLGLLLNLPSIGCAKSRLVGQHTTPGPNPGDYVEMTHGGEVIGVVLRTKAGAAPLYVSIGHRVDLEAAIRWTLACCRGHRLPEPTRLAHLAAAGRLPVTSPPEEAQQLALFS